MIKIGDLVAVESHFGNFLGIVNDKLDSGRIILQKKVKILKSDSGKIV